MKELRATRHERYAFMVVPVKTDCKDAHDIAQLMWLGWFRSDRIFTHGGDRARPRDDSVTTLCTSFQVGWRLSYSNHP